MKTLFAALLATIALGGCTVSKDIPDAGDVTCKVIKFTVPNEPEPVCAVECAWGQVGVEMGFADATPVPCSWYGKTVTRQ